MHLHAGKMLEDIGYFFQPGPVQLYILARADMRITLVKRTGNFRQFTQLRAVQKTVRYGDAQHGCQSLDIKAILQPQWQELSLGQLSGEKTLGLAAKLGDSLIDNRLVIFVVNVHQ